MPALHAKVLAGKTQYIPLTKVGQIGAGDKLLDVRRYRPRARQLIRNAALNHLLALGVTFNLNQKQCRKTLSFNAGAGIHT